MSHVAACVFVHVTSSHLTARLALLLCVDVDGGLIDTCECVVPWIVSGQMRYEKKTIILITNFKLMETKGKRNLFSHSPLNIDF